MKNIKHLELTDQGSNILEGKFQIFFYERDSTIKIRADLSPLYESMGEKLTTYDNDRCIIIEANTREAKAIY